MADQISTHQQTGWPKIVDKGTAESRPGLHHKGKDWKLPYLWMNQFPFKPYLLKEAISFIIKNDIINLNTQAILITEAHLHRD